MVYMEMDLNGHWRYSASSPFGPDLEGLEFRRGGDVIWNGQVLGRWLALEGAHFHLSLKWAGVQHHFALYVDGGQLDPYVGGDSVRSARRAPTRPKDWVGHWVSHARGWEVLFKITLPSFWTV